ncbi:hypothetical protein N8I71_10590 [Roseibacterium sp. SDUM158016]|uniref:hypothetical protein n=1 Tax=Roseicyclus sediminis TaxID=2980997 RepID=UPI0021D1A1EF|nr:hypothetical protein [Roseibacterium sp. SDUM158016]MCU4653283.1 hypothetical protein [Roseibacterium sp. SDUM158016]
MIEAHKIRVAHGGDHIDREPAADANEVLVDGRRRPFLTEGRLESPTEGVMAVRPMPVSRLQ